ANERTHTGMSMPRDACASSFFGFTRPGSACKPVQVASRNVLGVGRPGSAKTVPVEELPSPRQANVGNRTGWRTHPRLRLRVEHGALFARSPATESCFSR